MRNTGLAPGRPAVISNKRAGECRFHPARRWRFDFARPDIKLAVEYDGLLYGGPGGGHQRAASYEQDRHKDAEALLLGWRVLRVAAAMVQSGGAYRYIEGMAPC